MKQWYETLFENFLREIFFDYKLKAFFKFKYKAIFLLILGISLSSCEKNETSPVQNNFTLFSGEVTVLDGILKFSTVNFYNSFVDSEDEKSKSLLITELDGNIDYFSLKEKVYSFKKTISNSRTIGLAEVEVAEANEFLSTILNGDGMIAIGDYFFKINLNNETVYVLHSSLIDQLDDLKNENLSNSNIMVFSTEDDVLDMLGEGYTGSNNGRIALLCSDRKASGKEKIKYFEYSDNTAGVNYQVKAKHVYQKAGVYFSLLTELKHMSKFQSAGSLTPWSASNTEIYLEYYYKYKQRCRSGDNEGRSSKYTSWDNKLNRRHYESTRGLAKIWLESKYEFLARNADTGGVTVQLLIPSVIDGY